MAIVAMDAEGQVSFNTLQRNRHPLFVFDLLILGGRYMLRDALRIRREALDALVRVIQKKATAIELSQSVSAPAQDMIRAIKDLRLEGIIAKHQFSIYESGKRSGAWVKYKVNQGQEFVIGGYTPVILSTPSRIFALGASVGCE